MLVKHRTDATNDASKVREDNMSGRRVDESAEPLVVSVVVLHLDQKWLEKLGEPLNKVSTTKPVAMHASGADEVVKSFVTRTSGVGFVSACAEGVRVAVCVSFIRCVCIVRGQPWASPCMPEWA